MASLATRLIIGFGAIAAFALGLVDLTNGHPAGLIWIGIGVVGLLIVVFERVRYRSEAGAPGPPFQRTDETFVDPTTRRRMRVYLDPNTGERRYHAES